jgi:hypothetical protein
MANYAYITASTTVKPAAGKLRGIFVSAASSTPTITVYDSFATSTSRTIIGVFTPSAGTFYSFTNEGMYAKDGIYVVISGTVAATVIFD